MLNKKKYNEKESLKKTNIQRKEEDKFGIFKDICPQFIINTLRDEGTEVPN